MIKFRLYFDKDKEEKWLNEMADSGYEFKKFFAGFYKFLPCEKGRYIHRIDLIEGISKRLVMTISIARALYSTNKKIKLLENNKFD